MSFWNWAVSVYARAEVSDACLALQDRHGQSVPYLLWAAWAAVEGRVLDEARLKDGADLAERCEEVAIGPLRAVRRGMKAPVKGLSAPAREGVRERVRAAELAAERALIDALEALAPPPKPPYPRPIAPALAAAAQAWLSPAPPEALQALAQKLT